MDNGNCKLPAVSDTQAGLSPCGAGSLGLLSAATAVGEAVCRRAGTGVCGGALASLWCRMALCGWRRREEVILLALHSCRAAPPPAVSAVGWFHVCRC